MRRALKVSIDYLAAGTFVVFLFLVARRAGSPDETKGEGFSLLLLSMIIPVVLSITWMAFRLSREFPEIIGRVLLKRSGEISPIKIFIVAVSGLIAANLIFWMSSPIIKWINELI